MPEYTPLEENKDKKPEYHPMETTPVEIARFSVSFLIYLLSTAILIDHSDTVTKHYLGTRVPRFQSAWGSKVMI